MMRLRPFLARLGGPDAITWPLFWVSFASSALSQFAVPQPYVDLRLRIAGLMVAQAAMFVPLLLVRGVIVRRGGRPMPWLVLMGFLLATAVRAAVLAHLLRGPDGAVTVPFTTRLMGSLVQVFFVMVVTAVIVSTSRAHARDLAQLFEVQEQLDQARSATERQITEENEAALARVQEQLSHELAALEHVSDDTASVQALHRLASDVVRPLSHELAQSVPTWSPVATAARDSHVDWRQVLADFSRRGPFRPLLTGTAITLIMVAPSTIYLRPHAVAFLLALLASTVLTFWGANGILDRLGTRADRQGSPTIVLIVALAAAAVPAVLVGVIVGGVTGLLLALFGWAFLVGIAVLIGLLSSVFAAQRQTADELQASNRDLRISLVRIRQAQWFHQRALARALHGGMQSAVVAASFRIEAAREEGRVTPGFLAEVRADLARVIDVLGAQAHEPMSLDAFSAQLTSVWSRVADIGIEADPNAGEALEADPVLRAMVMEITTEAVSNAVRHGHAESIDVHLSCPDAEELRLQVSSDGKAKEERGRGGLGSRLLDDCTLGWSEAVIGGRHLLTASFACSAPPAGWPGPEGACNTPHPQLTS